MDDMAGARARRIVMELYGCVAERPTNCTYDYAVTF